MPRHTATINPELKAHQEWLGYLQPVGLVVAPAAMVDAGWVVTRSGSELIERQERYREAIQGLSSTSDCADPEPEADGDTRTRGFPQLETLLVEHLGWSADQIQSEPAQIESYSRHLPELGETLRPTALVPAANGEGVQLLLQVLPLLAPLDQKGTSGEHLWRATSQERFERLLRETGVEAGLLFNGAQLRLVVAPKGESSGHLTFPLAELAEVGCRLMFAGLELLLGQSPVFLDPDGYRLADVLKKSRSFQAVVSNALADQVLAALWELLRGFQRADELSQRQGVELLADLPERDPQQLYGGLITVLMRLVFLLYAEDEALMPADAVYEQNYKVSGIFERLRQDAADYPDTMEQRYGAWAGLMSLCRLVYAGGGATMGYLPARKGQLFDPGAYPWLETPWISDGVVLSVLSNLLVVKGERISYRALDVEQIGSVYEGIMGYAVRRIPGRCIGLKSKPQGAKKQLTTAVDLEALLELTGGKRKAWLEEEAGTTLPPKAATALKDAGSEAELLEALAPRIDQALFDGPQAAGGLVFQPTEERRRSGSHYTPRALTRPIVEEALRPWLERCEHKPTAAQILDLKICDPAMGSGAFLVESCRYLAELLEQAWSREGLPEALKPDGRAHGEEPLLYARRLIAQGCLYGVDKNPFAVNLARLSLWLVSLSKDAPFTFVDHALKCGDSLVGMERSEIEAALKGASLQRELQMEYLDQVRQQEARSFELFHADSRSDGDDAQKRQALDELNASTAYLRTVGDLLVAAFFNGKKPKDREELKKIYLEATLEHSSAEGLESELAEPLERLRKGEKGIQPLHWQLDFPDVFGREQPGFDVFVGNPPFAGSTTLAKSTAINYTEFLRSATPGAGGKCDLSVFFVRKVFESLTTRGTAGLITTASISEGENRVSGLGWLLVDKKISIYSARKSFWWPGEASVKASHFHFIKAGDKSFGSMVSPNSFNQFLLPSSFTNEPLQLAGSRSIAFLGCKPGTMYHIGSRDNIESDFPGFSGLQDSQKIRFFASYIGGNEILQACDCIGSRVACTVGMLDELDETISPELISILDSASGLNGSSDPSRFRFARRALDLQQAKSRCREAIARAEVTSTWAFATLEASHIFSNKAVVFCFGNTALLFGILSSRIHEVWAEALGSRQGDGISYSPRYCMENFALPTIALESDSVEQPGSRPSTIETLSLHYQDIRKSKMHENSEGLTDTYNRFHDPFETSSGLLELRRLHSEMDQAVLEAYGWSDVLQVGPCNSPCGFGLDYLDTDDDAQLPEELQERITGDGVHNSGELFFWEPDEACAFEAQLRATGAVQGKKKLPWHYRWPDDVREDVLARLLALNAERYAEEVALGLHGKTGKKPATNPAIGGKRRGRPAKAAESTDTGQIGLAL